MSNQTANPSIITRDLEKMLEGTDNIYKSIRVIASRAKQISVKSKEELNRKLAEFASTVDNLEEVFENREQIEISKFYERMPKSTVNAIHEFLDDKLEYRKRSES